MRTAQMDKAVARDHSDDVPSMLHLYRGRPVKMGSRALCGWVKCTPPDPSLWRTAEPTCMVCAHLAGRVR